MALGRGDATNEAAILRLLSYEGVVPCSTFRIAYADDPRHPGERVRTGVGGASTLSRLMAAGLVAYRPGQRFASDLDPLVYITDAGVEALRAFRAGETQGIVRSRGSTRTEVRG